MLRVIFIRLVFLWTLLAPILGAADLMEGVFESGGNQFYYEGISTFKYPFLKLTPHPTLLITHASHYWDTKHHTWPAIESLVKTFRNQKLPIKYLAAIEERSFVNHVDLKLTGLYFPPGINQDDLYPFQGDSHRMIATGQHLVIAGGNFTICACSTVRSIIALSESPAPLQIHFAMDAIYEGQNGVLLTLKEISERLDDEAFIKYLKLEYFNQDTLPCKEPSLFALHRQFSYEIYRSQKLIGRFNGGPNLVILHFEDSLETLRQLKLNP